MMRNPEKIYTIQYWPVSVVFFLSKMKNEALSSGFSKEDNASCSVLKFQRATISNAGHDRSAYRLITVGGTGFAADVFVVEFDTGIADLHHFAYHAHHSYCIRLSP